LRLAEVRRVYLFAIDLFFLSSLPGESMKGNELRARVVNAEYCRVKRNRREHMVWDAVWSDVQTRWCNDVMHASCPECGACFMSVRVI
jgi:hypothetical protein